MIEFAHTINFGFLLAVATLQLALVLPRDWPVTFLLLMVCMAIGLALYLAIQLFKRGGGGGSPR